MPVLWRLEVLNVIAVAERQRKISSVQGDRFLELLAALAIVVEDLPSSERTLAYAGQHQLSAYDATYLAFAVAHRLTLATLDGGLMRAAEAIGQPLFSLT
ncbi:MAG: type II toxin-antitoxin system VapC family toxin, partial [Chloroflexota bacterium]